MKVVGFNLLPKYRMGRVMYFFFPAGSCRRLAGSGKSAGFFAPASECEVRSSAQTRPLAVRMDPRLGVAARH